MGFEDHSSDSGHQVPNVQWKQPALDAHGSPYRSHGRLNEFFIHSNLLSEGQSRGDRGVAAGDLSSLRCSYCFEHKLSLANSKAPGER